MKITTISTIINSVAIILLVALSFSTESTVEEHIQDAAYLSKRVNETRKDMFMYTDSEIRNLQKQIEFLDLRDEWGDFCKQVPLNKKGFYTRFLLKEDKIGCFIFSPEKKEHIDYFTVAFLEVYKQSSKP